jgi:hypothetical protein
MIFNDLEKNEETYKEEVFGDYSLPVVSGVEVGSIHDLCASEVAVGELVN